MGMGFTGITVAQLKGMMPDALKRLERKDSLFSEPAIDGCGICPICHEFVYARFDRPGALASCPSCTGLVDTLEPFGIP